MMPLQPRTDLQLLDLDEALSEGESSYGGGSQFEPPNLQTLIWVDYQKLWGCHAESIIDKDKMAAYCLWEA